MTKAEAPLDPARPIIDPHLHFWHIHGVPGIEPQRFLLDEALETIAASGHAVTHSIYVECGQMYRAEGPRELRALGETEFVNGIAAMSASGGYGPRRLGHRIVGSADLTLGARVRDVLDKHRERAGERFRGVRMDTAWSAYGLFGQKSDPRRAGIMTRSAFVEGARALAALDLSLDIWCLHTQLGEVAALADALPDLTIILDHLGTPECTGPWAQRPDEAFSQWAAALGDLAQRPNVLVKVGGMGMNVGGTLAARDGPAGGEALAAEWRARVETAIAAFTPARAMFESNFPPDRCAAGYGATWNAFKRLSAGYSEDEKDRLFRGTAAQVYRI